MNEKKNENEFSIIIIMKGLTHDGPEVGSRDGLPRGTLFDAVNLRISNSKSSEPLLQELLSSRDHQESSDKDRSSDPDRGAPEGNKRDKGRSHL